MQINGRYPSRGIRIEPAKMTCGFTPESGRLCLRIDDDNCPEFWLEVHLSPEDVDRMFDALRTGARYYADKAELANPDCTKENHE